MAANGRGGENAPSKGGKEIMPRYGCAVVGQRTGRPVKTVFVSLVGATTRGRALISLPSRGTSGRTKDEEMATAAAVLLMLPLIQVEVPSLPLKEAVSQLTPIVCCGGPANR